MKEYLSLPMDNFYCHLQERTNFHSGYPYNLNYDYSEILHLFQFSINNLCDPFIPSNYQIDSREFEVEVLNFFAELYQCQNHWGYVTNSGTEGNLYGLLLGRESYPDGILYASADSHYSIKKASHFFKIRYVKVKSQNNGEMDYEDFLNVLNPNYPAIINLNLGTTFKGAIDNIERILESLETKKIRDFYIHCDGALGGMLVPYLTPNHPINFNLPIHSLAISGHKFIGCPFPCGIVLTYQTIVDQFSKHIEYIGSKDATIGGSRNGHAPIFLWYAIQKRKHLFAQEAKSSVSKANYLYNQLEKAGLFCLLNPYSSTVVFPKPTDDIAQKWQLATLGNYAHVVLMQNHSQEIIDHLIDDLIDSNNSLQSCNRPLAKV